MAPVACALLQGGIVVNGQEDRAGDMPFLQFAGSLNAAETGHKKGAAMTSGLNLQTGNQRQSSLTLPQSRIQVIIQPQAIRAVVS
jgi:hypothetical protein